MTHSCLRHDGPSRRCYCVCGCRCPECREHQRLYAAKHAREKAYGKVHRVPAEPIRQRVRAAQRAGVGWKRIADLAGVSRSSFQKLMSGRSATVNIRTAEAIMAVKLERADGSYIPADQYLDALDRLIRAGWTKRDLGVWLTGNLRARSLQVRGPQITVRMAKRIVELVNLIEADRVRCVACGVHVRKQALCGGCRVRRNVPA